MTIESATAVIIKTLRTQGVLKPKHEVLLSQGHDVDLASLSIDSVGIFNLCMELEDAVGREIRIGELVENATVLKLARHLAPEMPAAS